MGLIELLALLFKRNGSLTNTVVILPQKKLQNSLRLNFGRFWIFSEGTTGFVKERKKVIVEEKVEWFS